MTAVPSTATTDNLLLLDADAVSRAREAQNASSAVSSPVATFRADVLNGLTGSPKTLPCKYLYDEAGSDLFDRICDLDEYYVTRTELAILEGALDEIAASIGSHPLLIEPGAGSGLKTRMLLDRLEPSAYVPVDISGDYLATVADRLRDDFPLLTVLPVAGDFTRPFEIPEDDSSARLLYFPGSTIGNFVPAAAESLLRDWAAIAGEDGSLLIGVDLEKDPAVLEAAYDDRDGVTAAFDLNLLRRINRELHGDFDVAAFRHEARYNSTLRRVEMHLVSETEQEVHVSGRAISFAAGESIHTENSHKYSLGRFAAIAESAGWRVDRVWTDPDELFSVQLLRTS